MQGLIISLIFHLEIFAQLGFEETLLFSSLMNDTHTHTHTLCVCVVFLILLYLPTFSRVPFQPPRFGQYLTYFNPLFVINTHLTLTWLISLVKCFVSIILTSLITRLTKFGDVSTRLRLNPGSPDPFYKFILKRPLSFLFNIRFIYFKS